MRYLFLQSTWSNYAVYNGAGDLSPWGSIGQIASTLVMLGFLISGVVLLIRIMKGDFTEVGKMIINFAIGALVAGVLLAIV